MLSSALQLHFLFRRVSPRRHEQPKNAVHTLDAGNAALAVDVVAGSMVTAEVGGTPAVCSTEANPRWRTARPRLQPGAAPYLRYPLGASARAALDDRAAAHLHDTD